VQQPGVTEALSDFGLQVLRVSVESTVVVFDGATA